MWKDNTVLKNNWRLFKEASLILPIGSLVKSLLMANHCDPFSRISKEHEGQVDSTQLTDNPKDSLAFCLEVVPLGCIIRVGPSASDITSNKAKRHGGALPPTSNFQPTNWDQFSGSTTVCSRHS